MDLPRQHPSRRHVLVGLGAGLGAALAPRARAAEAIRVGIPQPAFSFLHIDIAAETGLLARHGVAVEKLVFGGAARMHQALAAGSLDIAFGAGPEFGFLAKGAAEKAVAATANLPADLAITVLADGPIREVRQLRGRRVSCSTRGSLTEWAGQQLSRNLGWGNDGITVVALGAFAAQLSALKTGQIDAMISSATVARQIAAAGTGRLLMSFENVVPDFHINVVFAADAFIATQPDQLRAFLAALDETERFMRADRAGTVAIAAHVLDIDPALAGTLYDTLMPQANDGLRFRQRALDVLAQAMVDMGELEQKPDMRALLTEAYLPAR